MHFFFVYYDQYQLEAFDTLYEGFIEAVTNIKPEGYNLQETVDKQCPDLHFKKITS